MAIVTRDKRAADSVFAHASTREMHERARKKDITTIFERYQSQQPQCGFGMSGVCCQLCSHGPCRITPKAPTGICGASADTIAARNIVRLASHGLAAYTHHLEQIANTIIATAEGKTPFQITDEPKLRLVAGIVGLDVNKPTADLAIELSKVVLAEMRKESNEPLALVKALAPATRYEAWEKLGIIPGGPLSEVRDAMTKSMTSIDTDPVDLLLTTMRLSIATGYMGLIATGLMQDILLGTPAITQSESDLGVLDPETVNIVAHGHIPLMATAVLQVVEDESLQEAARKVGAKGIKVYGSMCTGQELMQRNGGSARGFDGQLGNWINQEFYVATGAIDLVMMDMNCTTPGLKTMADNFHTRLVSVDKIVRMAGVDALIDYDPSKVAEQAKALILMAIEAYEKRGDDIQIPEYKQKVIAGFSVESILGALGGSLDPLLNAIKDGAIKGIVAVVGCTNMRNGHDTTGIALTKELIKNDILVINAGCMSSAMQMAGLMDPAAASLAGDGLRAVCESLGIPPCLNFGSCLDIGRIGVAVTAIAGALGVDPSQLPVAASAPEYLEQKAVADGVFAVSFGLLTHLGPLPPVTGAPLVTRILTKDVEQMTGGKVLVEQNPKKAAAMIIEHIEEKRRALGLT